MKQPSINARLKDIAQRKQEYLEAEYAALLDTIFEQPGAPSAAQIARKNYLETELYILNTNNKLQ